MRPVCRLRARGACDGFCVRDGTREKIGGVGDKNGMIAYCMNFSKDDCKIATVLIIF
ncbi:Uncharacterised protein [Yersinia thracica]|uniref:Uncharacterized protein n=1 Tax=Yersinia thracica TaxID=2890319 RepID=A0A0T9P349_9GAMM|nr:Uncharacterised protein [Yersinia thracica]